MLSFTSSAKALTEVAKHTFGLNIIVLTEDDDPLPDGRAMKRISVALVGYGLAGKVFHAPLISSMPGFSLDRIVSSDPSKVHRDYPQMRVVADFPTVLAEADIDLVVLATPDAVHAPQACAALQAGKHVVVDKPFAPTLAEARDVAAFAAHSGRLLSIFHNRRWDADFLTLQRLIGAGQLGEVVQFESHFDRFRPGIGTRWKDVRVGGVWQDLAPHLIDQAICLFGMPDAVFADIGVQRPGGTSPDYAHALLRCGPTRVILHMSQLAARHDLRFAIHGTRGSYIKHGLDPQEEQAKAGLQPSDPDWGIDPRAGTLFPAVDGQVWPACQIDNEPGDYPAFYRGIERALRFGSPNPVTPSEALAVMIVLEAGLISAREGRLVETGEL